VLRFGLGTESLPLQLWFGFQHCPLDAAKRNRLASKCVKRPMGRDVASFLALKWGPVRLCNHETRCFTPDKLVENYIFMVVAFH
jgi:hypothetical protein